MRIHKLTLYNFRQFIDFTLDFSTDSNKNVTVVLAKNSTGKTTLMQSVNWCLYGEDETELENKNSMLNQVVQARSRNDKETYSVELQVFEDNELYTIKRARTVSTKSHRFVDERLSLQFKNSYGETIILDASRSLEEKKKINRMINKILTKEMSKYFLFDGERINNLGSNNARSRKDIQKAISAISGLPIIENALSSLKKIERQYRNDLIESAKDADLTKLNNQRNKLEIEKNDISKEIDSIENELSKQKTEKDELDESLSHYDKIDTLIKERKKYENQVEKLTEDIPDLRERINLFIKEHRRKSLIFKLNLKYSNLKFNESYKEKTIPNMQADSLDTIIERGVCICGEELTSDHIKHLNEQKTYQPPISNAQLINDFKRSITYLSKGLDDLYANIESQIDYYYTQEDHITTLKEQIEDLNERIGNADSEEIKNKNLKRGVLKEQIFKNTEKLGMFKEKENAISETISSLVKEYDVKSKEKSLNDIKKLKVDLVLDSIKMLEEKNKEDRKLQKDTIQKKANTHLNDIIYKNKNIEIKDTFEYVVRENNNEIASPSEGERVSISISLILAIIDAHKEIYQKRISTGLGAQVEKKFSILMDAAFATLDEQFSQRISQKLPKSIEQVILFSTPRQFDGPVKISLAPYLGKLYKINIPTGERENQLTNKDLDVLEVEGVK